MTAAELATYWLSTSSDHAARCVPEPAESIIDDLARIRKPRMSTPRPDGDPMNTRYLPRDHGKLDLYAETYPELAEAFSVLADEEPSPAKAQAVYYGLLRLDMAHAG